MTSPGDPDAAPLARVPRYGIVAIVVTAGIGATAFLFSRSREGEQRRVEGDFENAAQNHAAALQRSIELELLLIESLRSWYMSADGGEPMVALAVGAAHAVDLRQEHGELFFRALPRVISASLDAEYSFRALLTAIRLIVGAIGFLAFALLILGRRRSAAVAGLGAAILACATAAMYAGPSLAANLVTCTVAAAVALIVARWPEAGDTWSRLTLGSAALAGCLALSNFLVFHDWRIAEPEPWGPINFQDQFHYYLGAKYFGELSYDGLYACAASAAAERGESNGARPARDLRTNQVVTTTDIIRQSGSCRARFTPERWKSFSDDVAFFFDAVNDRARTRYTRDHGYNAAPLLTVIHRPFVAWTGASSATLAGLAMIDVALFLACVVLIAWGFGPMAASLTTLAWGTGVLWVQSHVGIPGAMGRLWWVAAIVAAVCLARRQRFIGTGVCLSVAALLRAFPAVFLFVPTILAASQVATTRRVSSALASVLIGAALGGVGLAVISTVGVGGISPYEAFLANSSKHAASSVSNFVGLPRLISRFSRGLALPRRDPHGTRPCSCPPWLSSPMPPGRPTVSSPSPCSFLEAWRPCSPSFRPTTTTMWSWYCSLRCC